MASTSGPGEAQNGRAELTVQECTSEGPSAPGETRCTRNVRDRDGASPHSEEESSSAPSRARAATPTPMSPQRARSRQATGTIFNRVGAEFGLLTAGEVSELLWATPNKANSVSAFVDLAPVSLAWQDQKYEHRVSSGVDVVHLVPVWPVWQD